MPQQVESSQWRLLQTTYAECVVPAGGSQPGAGRPVAAPVIDPGRRQALANRHNRFDPPNRYFGEALRHGRRATRLGRGIEEFGHRPGQLAKLAAWDRNGVPLGRDDLPQRQIVVWANAYKAVQLAAKRKQLFGRQWRDV